jgi:hypothetical protein
VALLAVGFLLAVIGFLTGAVTVWRLYAPMLEQAHKAEATATDRLVAAWHDGAQIPPREEDLVDHAPEPLHPVVQDYVDQFDPAGRAVYEAKARSLMAQNVEPHEIEARLDMYRHSRGEVIV